MTNSDMGDVPVPLGEEAADRPPTLAYDVTRQRSVLITSDGLKDLLDADVDQRAPQTLVTEVKTETSD